MDWEVCVICQKGGHGLKCPADSNQKNGLEIYTDFLKAVEQFRELDVMPVNLDLKGIDSPEVFLENRACWHKACKLKFAASRVQKETENVNMTQMISLTRAVENLNVRNLEHQIRTLVSSVGWESGQFVINYLTAQQSL